MNKRHQVCCFTGHRRLSTEDRAWIARRLPPLLESLIAEGVRYFGVGGALGFDTLAAQAVLELQKNHPDVRLIVVVPCRDQTKGWPPADIAVYENMLSRADKAVYLSEQYTNGCMLRRNRHMVDHSGVCVAYLKHSHGGTAYTVRYAKQQGLHVINLAAEAGG